MGSHAFAVLPRSVFGANRDSRATGSALDPNQSAVVVRFPAARPVEFEVAPDVWLPSGTVEGMETAMHHWSFGAVIAFATGLVVATVLIFASIRSRKKTDA